MKPLWNDENINFLRLNYPSRGKDWCCQKLGMKEHQVRYKASHLGLRVDFTSPFYRSVVERRANTVRGRKRPEHSRLMKQYAKENRVLASRHVVTKQIACSACKKAFFPTTLRGNANFRCCSTECAKARLSRPWPTGTHPRGMLGKSHSQEFKQAQSIRAKERWANPDSALNSAEHRQHLSDRNTIRHASGNFYNDKGNAYSRCQSGWFENDGKKYFMRSKWERNYAWYLTWLEARGDIASWEYEVDTFWFESIRRGVRSYKPDFKVKLLNGDYEYHEVKGWMDDKSKTKIKRMAKYYPDVELIIIDADAYKSIKKWSRLVPGWE